MIIYWDVVLILNICINFIFLVLIDTLHRERINYKLTIFSSLLGGGLVFSYLLNYQLFLFFKLCGGVLIAGVCYLKNHLIKLLTKISSFYILNFMFVGMLSSFKITNFVILLIVGFFMILLIIIDANKRLYYYLIEHEYTVILELDGRILKLKGFLDTGNLALNKDSIPIIFIDNKYFVNDLTKYDDYLLQTINHHQIISLYRPNKCIIYYQKKYIEKEVLISFSDLGRDFDCLLNGYLFI